jgi:hypothetical protein
MPEGYGLRITLMARKEPLSHSTYHYNNSTKNLIKANSNISLSPLPLLLLLLRLSSFLDKLNAARFPLQ